MDHVLNWLWQGCVVAGATSLSLRLMTRSRAQFRYVLGLIGLAVVMTLPILPILNAMPAATPLQASIGAVPAAETVIAVPDTWWTSTTVILSLCAVWTAVYALRIGGALRALRRARRRCRPYPIAAESRLQYWNLVKASGRTTQLVVSRDVRAAAILGCGSPSIAVAPALIRHLDPDELDRIVIHEWAHVQRRDDWLNLAQLAVRALAGWHPAVWWLNRHLQIEREAACDEMTVAVTGSPKGYAASLAKTAVLQPARRRLVPAPGVLSGPALRGRIVRILAYRRLESKARSLRTALAASASVVGLALCVGALRLVGPAALAAPFEPRDIGATPVVHRDHEPSAGPVAMNPVRRPGTGSRPTGEMSRPSSGSPARDIIPPLDRSAAAGDGTPEPSGAPPPMASAFPALVAAGVTAPAVSPITLGVPPSKPSSQEVTIATPWSAAADVGVSVGRVSEKAAVATAGFFTRLGKKIAGSF